MSAVDKFTSSLFHSSKRKKSGYSSCADALLGALILLGFTLLVLLASEQPANAQEFVIFTKTQDQRFPACSSASQAQCERFNSSQPACTINIFSCRGYDPTRNISSGLNTPINCPDLQTNCPAPTDGALELFIHLGPGEATGNMHGRIQGVNGSICKEISSADPSSKLCAGVGNLNLGIEKYNPKSQDDNAPCVGIFNASSPTGTGDPNPAEDCTNPTGNGSNTAGMTSADGFHGFSEQFARNDDFFPGAIEHAGFKFDVSFKWMDQNTLATCNQNRTGMVQHTSPCTHASQSVEQVTALDSDLGIGTRANPGPGDQVVHINVLGWSAKNNDDTFTTPGNAATQATGINPRIAWQQTIKDPNFSGLSGYDDEMNGAFTYCHGAHNNPGDPCFSVVLPDAIYPTGTSQTIGDFKSCLSYDPSTGNTEGACP